MNYFLLKVFKLIILLNVKHTLFIKLRNNTEFSNKSQHSITVCVWEDPGPFPYLEILREENQSEPKRLID